MNEYELTIEHQGEVKHLYTTAEDAEQAATKFNRHITCQWVGYPWDGPESLLDGTFDKLADGDTIL